MNEFCVYESIQFAWSLRGLVVEGFTSFTQKNEATWLAKNIKMTCDWLETDWNYKAYFCLQDWPPSAFFNVWRKSYEILWEKLVSHIREGFLSHQQKSHYDFVVFSFFEDKDSK